jgi:hypothetical protein
VKVRGIRTGGTVDGIVISGEHAELRQIFEYIVHELPGPGAHPARELAVRCLAVLSSSGAGVIVDGDDGVEAALADDDLPEGEN